MSEVRDALEGAQARLRSLEAEGAGHAPLEALAAALEHEASQYERLLDRAERHGRRPALGQAERIQTTGFAVLFVTPVVVLISASLARSLRAQAELSVLLLILGCALITALFWPRATRALVRLVSPEWRLLRRARKAAALVRKTLPEAA